MTWFSLTVESTHPRDVLVSALVGAGATGVQEDGTRLITHFDSMSAARSAAESVHAIDPAAREGIEPVADTDWSRAWRQGLAAFSLGTLTISPPWLAGGADAGRTIVIEPGMAFGTGDHASTRGAIRLLQRVVHAGVTVADLGTGSAVLAIAAARLGARRVVAIEIDPDALDNARENIERNGVTSEVHLVDGDAAIVLPLVAPFDVVVANILAPVIVRLLPVIAGALTPGARVVVAGILDTERDQFGTAAAAIGWNIVDDDLEDGWWSTVLVRA